MCSVYQSQKKDEETTVENEDAQKNERHPKPIWRTKSLLNQNAPTSHLFMYQACRASFFLTMINRKKVF